MQPHPLRFGLLLAGAIAFPLGACSDDDTSTVPDSGTPSDATSEGSPCGPLLICKEGSEGKACSQVPSTPKCVGTTWQCPVGSISASLCGCAADNTRPVGADCGKDASVDDAAADAAGDAPTESGSDAADGGTNG